jgi:lipoprotein-anchoring transpeptidase ErfK/SrfK
MRGIALFTGIVALVISMVSITPVDAAGNKYFDGRTGKWVALGGHGRSGGRSSIPRKEIDYSTKHRPGTIVINTKERRLYFVLPKGRALRYGIGVGRDGFQWSGTHRITQKKEWPGWTPPPVMIRRERANGRILPAYMPGGIDNPLGARALYIGSTIYRIHGTNRPSTIGGAVSSGCIRLTNNDIEHLYEQARVGARVVVMR